MLHSLPASVLSEGSMKFILIFLFVGLIGCASAAKKSNPLVLMTDFSLRDGAVSAMKGVAYQVKPDLVVSDLTHEIPPFHIWEGAYRLSQTYKYWPPGTVFVCVVDPGVGSQRRSLAVRTNSGHIFVGPDNGLLTLLEDQGGLSEVRVIDETKQRLKGSEDSYTFHGRDLYVYVGARLASGATVLSEVGELSTQPVLHLDYRKAEFKNGELYGMIPILDVNYGNVWTGISKSLLESSFPGRKDFNVRIFHGKKLVYEARLPLTATFAGVAKGKPLLYINSLMNLSLALNEGDFAKRFKIRSGPEWSIVVK